MQGLFGPFLDLVEGLGWRVSAVCQLRAEDFDATRAPAHPHGRLHRRAENDKMGVGAWVLITETARNAVLEAMRVSEARTGWLFPAPKVDGKPWSRHYAKKLLTRAEKKANLEHVEGGGFHAFRRKWATERKHHPEADVMRAGGADARSLQQSYQRHDDETTLAVIMEPRRLRDARKQGA